MGGAVDWNARIDAVRAANLAAVGRFGQRIGEIDAAARAAMTALGERAETRAARVAREERERLLRQDAQVARRRDAVVLPTDWSEADEARWRG
ncbi:hypothetical protein D7D52_23785 [Nocardia yunnanensis]|uniref:Uncharacterized protein n=1 Tax=Nocardia yunnanensis TaxID=2382165 RepID=A0A386ZFW6_9NOCA|nr:hypothetical protein [Nocardia yunnanensis]AYF76347.1 hypothetical protein D7D52_23785 [Nocardia yunnanensis]